MIDTPVFDNMAMPTAPQMSGPATEPAPALDADLSAKRNPLVVLVPSRGRPDAFARIVEAWAATGASEVATLVPVLDMDDPYVGDYAIGGTGVESFVEVYVSEIPGGDGMCSKLNAAARAYAADQDVVAIAFQGDDHIPRTNGWAQQYLAELDQLRALKGVGVVYGNDGLRGEALCTEWAVTASWVRTLNRLVPSLVSHLYSDTSVLALGRAVGCITYLAGVEIEHMHPLATGDDGQPKGEWDDVNREANTAARKAADRSIYDRWSVRTAGHAAAGLASQAAKLRALKP